MVYTVNYILFHRDGGIDHLNIHTFRETTDLNIVHWDSSDSLSEKITEVLNAQKQYTNDVVELHLNKQ